MASLVLVAFVAACEVDDQLGPVDRRFDPLAGGQVADHVLDFDSLFGLMTVSAEHPYLAAGVPQPRNDEAPEGARAAGDQRCCLHLLFPSCHIACVWTVIAMTRLKGRM